MRIYSDEEILNALQVVSSTISKCEKIQPKFAEGTSQHTLLKNRIKAMYISREFMIEGSEIEGFTNEELIDAIKPIASVISKCETGQRKYALENPQYKRYKKIIDAMNIAKALITEEINKRG